MTTLGYRGRHSLLLQNKNTLCFSSFPHVQVQVTIIATQTFFFNIARFSSGTTNQILVNKILYFQLVPPPAVHKITVAFSYAVASILILWRLVKRFFHCKENSMIVCQEFNMPNSNAPLITSPEPLVLAGNQGIWFGDFSAQTEPSTGQLGASSP